MEFMLNNLPIIFGEITSGIPDMTAFLAELTSAITPTQVLTMLGSVIGVGMGFVLMWFGARKAVSIFSKAVQKGKIGV